MSKTMSSSEMKSHCHEAISDLSKLLEEFASTGSGKMFKRAMLLSYWIKTYVQYIKNEDKFAPQSVFRLKRGAIVRVEFGYRIGRELGGRHYAVVLDVDNPIRRNTVTVVPLGSIKEDSDKDWYSVVLDDGIYGPVRRKVDALIDDANRTADEAFAMNEEIEAASAADKPVMRAVQRQKIDATRNLIEQASAWIKEIDHMKSGSVAKVDQITTISKMRISQPLQKTHPLYGVRLSDQDLDKIDQKLQELYFPKRA